jgi:hypothetical protein
MTIMSLDHSLKDIHYICKKSKIQQIVHTNSSILRLATILNSGPCKIDNGLIAKP